MLPHGFDELNTYYLYNYIRVFGLKVRDVKFVKNLVKGRKVELKERKRRSEQNFELWEKTIVKNLDKKFKVCL